MNMWLVYFVLKLDDVQLGLGLGVFLLTLILIFLRSIAWFKFDDSCKADEDKKTYNRECKRLLKFYVIPVILFIVCTFIPDSRTAAVLYVLPKIANNKQINKMPSKIVTLANDWIGGQIKSNKQ